jgi:hypothetical protein
VIGGPWIDLGCRPGRLGDAARGPDLYAAGARQPCTVRPAATEPYQSAVGRGGGAVGNAAPGLGPTFAVGSAGWSPASWRNAEARTTQVTACAPLALANDSRAVASACAVVVKGLGTLPGRLSRGLSVFDMAQRSGQSLGIHGIQAIAGTSRCCMGLSDDAVGRWWAANRAADTMRTAGVTALVPTGAFPTALVYVGSSSPSLRLIIAEERSITHRATISTT